jgi:abortive infection bacteriophage resistance protein
MKLPKTISEQIDLLEVRNMIFNDEGMASSVLLDNN